MTIYLFTNLPNYNTPTPPILKFITDDDENLFDLGTHKIKYKWKCKRKRMYENTFYCVRHTETQRKIERLHKLEMFWT